MDILKVYIHKYIKLKLVEEQRYAKKKKLLSVKWTEKYKKKRRYNKKKWLTIHSSSFFRGQNLNMCTMTPTIFSWSLST